MTSVVMKTMTLEKKGKRKMEEVTMMIKRPKRERKERWRSQAKSH